MSWLIYISGISKKQSLFFVMLMGWGVSRLGNNSVLCIRINPEFRILRLTFHGKSASKPGIRLTIIDHVMPAFIYMTIG